MTMMNTVFIHQQIIKFKLMFISEVLVT